MEIGSLYKFKISQRCPYYDRTNDLLKQHLLIYPIGQFHPIELTPRVELNVTVGWLLGEEKETVVMYLGTVIIFNDTMYGKFMCRGQIVYIHMFYINEVNWFILEEL